MQTNQNRSSWVRIDPSRDALLTDFGQAVLIDRYLLPGESPQQRFAAVASAYADNPDHAQRLYDYISRLWLMPSTPVLSNGGTERGLPISCFLNEASDSLEGIVDLWTENVWLAARGGGIGSYWGNLRGLGESIGQVGQSSGVIPFIRVMDSQTLAISQGSLRRGSAAVYLPVDHPEIEEFIELRRPTGGDPNRKSLNLHHGVLLSDAFMQAVESGSNWALKSPHTGEVMDELPARELWIRLLTARIETGEPYLIFSDSVARGQSAAHRELGLEVKTSNLCAEITLPTGIDHRGQNRTAVCCLSSLNLAHYKAWRDHPGFIEDALRFLDNVLEDFIRKAPPQMAKAVYAAQRERSVGLGVMGLHSFLQAEGVPFASVMAKVWNKKIFSHIQQQANAASEQLAKERGACPDNKECNIEQRFCHKTAIAPTASISIIAGGTSAGIEPIAANAYTHKTLSGSFAVRNPALETLLAEKGLNNEITWRSIITQQGSVQHLDCLDEWEKLLFQTAAEIDQGWLIELAADRAPLIDQAQSLNLFLPPDIHKRELHQLHFSAWKKGIKSLYYCRSQALSRAEVVPGRANQPAVSHMNNYEECLACQ